MLLAIYGLRASEVVTLRLDDVDWDHDQLHVARVKRRGPQAYPLLPSVGNAILRYVHGSAPSTHRESFSAHLARSRCLAPPTAWSPPLERSASRRYRGPHALRHACAARLVRGLSEGVGDHLGHQTPRPPHPPGRLPPPQVAAFDLGGCDTLTRLDAYIGSVHWGCLVRRSNTQNISPTMATSYQQSPDAVRMFIAGTGPVTAFWRRSGSSCAGSIASRSVEASRAPPLAGDAAAISPPLTPYIYSREGSAACWQPRERSGATVRHGRSPSDPPAPLYGTGMRIGSPLADAPRRRREPASSPSATQILESSRPTVSQLTTPSPSTSPASLPLPSGEASALFATHRQFVLRRRESAVPARAATNKIDAKECRYQPRLRPASLAAVHRLIAGIGRGGRAALLPRGHLSRRRRQLHAAIPHRGPELCAKPVGARTVCQPRPSMITDGQSVPGFVSSCSKHLVADINLARKPATAHAHLAAPS
jgi:hypothetical protein